MMIKEFAPFSPAETRFLEELSTSERTIIGDGELPETDASETEIRAELLRAALIGKQGLALPEKGLRLRGATIKGVLDLQGCDVGFDITLTQCVIKGPINLINARLRGVHFTGCDLSSLSADNAIFAGSVYLRGETIVRGEIAMAGARIDGDLQICGAEIYSDESDAIFAPSLRVDGSVFLGNYPYSAGETRLVSQGMLFFSSCRVGHDFFVSNVAISISSEPATIQVFSATEEHGRDIALSMARAKIGGLLYLQDNQITAGIVNLAGAQVQRLKDEPAGPGASYPIRLDGFRYVDFSRHTDTDIHSRLAWLERRPKGTPFTTQPYEQLAYVLGQIGHRRDAQTVLMQKERLNRLEARSHMQRRPARRLLSWISDTVLRLTVGYGFRPGRAAVLGIILILGLGVFFTRVWTVGDMTPNAAPILVSSDWIAATKSHPANPGAFWASPGQAGQDWESFNGYAYAADLVIPIVSLGQEDAWAPSTSRSELGRVGWWLRWFAKAIGWILTALGAGAITGVIRRD